MRKVNYITVTELTRTVNRDLMAGKRPATLITTFYTKFVCGVETHTIADLISQVMND